MAPLGVKPKEAARLIGKPLSLPALAPMPIARSWGASLIVLMDSINGERWRLGARHRTADA